LTSESPNEPAATRRSRRAASAAKSAELVADTRADDRPATEPEAPEVVETLVVLPDAEPVADAALADAQPRAVAIAEAVPPVTRRAIRRPVAAPVEEAQDSLTLAHAEALAPREAVVEDVPVAEPVADEALWARAPHESALPVAESEAATADHDAFRTAARLFSFTGEVALTPASPVAEPALEAEPASDAVERGARPRRFSMKRVATASFSVGVLGIVGLLAVGMTTAPQAVAAANGTASKTSNLVVAGDVAATDGEIQAYVAPTGVQNVALDRSDYSTGSIGELAAEVGVTQVSDFYVNNPNAPIQWPFAVGVGISYGFGWRYGGAEFHEGADFTPGEGAHVQAIADGVVRIATEDGGAYGVTVLIDHQIDGQLISTRYAHMLHGSLQVKAGDTVKVGQYLGRTGNTGRSYGAHTHVEVLLNGTTPIDPIEWLRAHAG
jgi:murein DD-endopeptidase MepM/ murein hydrolase activator NlpD